MKDVVHRGTLTKEKMHELFLKSIPEGLFVIEKQEDGNYRGWTRKWGNLVEVRDIGPETVLQHLLTHDGQ